MTTAEYIEQEKARLAYVKSIKEDGDMKTKEDYESRLVDYRASKNLNEELRERKQAGLKGMETVENGHWEYRPRVGHVWIKTISISQ